LQITRIFGYADSTWTGVVLLGLVSPMQLESANNYERGKPPTEITKISKSLLEYLVAEGGMGSRFLVAPLAEFGSIC
jgi:hypothetical protein